MIQAPGGNTGSRYVSEVLLANVKKIIKNSATTEAREKNKRIFGMLRILEFFMYVHLNLTMPGLFIVL